jgi:hypothetical protein
MFDVTVRVCVFVVVIFAVVAKTFMVVTAFDTYTLPVIVDVVRPFVPVSVSVAAKMFVAVTAFDVYKLPVTLIPVTPVAGVTTTFEATTLP